MSMENFDLDVLWYFGPTSGIGKLNNVHYYFDFDQEDIEDETLIQKFHVRQLPFSDILYEHLRRLLFRVMVVKSPYDWTMFAFYKVCPPTRETKYQSIKVIGQYTR